MPFTVDVAGLDDLPEFLASAEALVATDAGQFDPDATDLGWAATTGVAYGTALLAGNDDLVLLARDAREERVLGHLVARLRGPSSVHPIVIAELESIHVYPDHRGHGIGDRLMTRFLAWAVDRGAQRVSVTAYAANDGAQRFYARHGFSPRSVVLDRDAARRDS